MSQFIYRMSLSKMLKSAASGNLERGWVYLPDEEITVDSHCVLIADEAHEEDENGDPKNAGVPLGFPIESLDTQTIESICDGVKLLSGNPDDDLYLRAFSYYCEFDAFLPSIDASDPPPLDVAHEKLDREFYNSLGDERTFSRCRREQCERGAVNMSAFCRKHHFEMVRQRPYIYE